MKNTKLSYKEWKDEVAEFNDPEECLQQEYVKYTESFISQLVEALRISVVEVRFTKVNGDIRVMRCSNAPGQIPVMPTAATDSVAAALISETTIVAFEVDLGQWRSFNKDSVIDWTIS